MQAYQNTSLIPMQENTLNTGSAILLVVEYTYWLSIMAKNLIVFKIYMFVKS